VDDTSRFEITDVGTGGGGRATVPPLETRRNDSKILAQGLEKLPSADGAEIYSGRIFRSTSKTIPSDGDFLASYSRPVSFSASPEKAGGFLAGRLVHDIGGDYGRGVGVIYKVKSNTGKVLGKFGDFDELEVLYPHGSGFKIKTRRLRTSTDGDYSFWEMELEEVDSIPSGAAIYDIINGSDALTGEQINAIPEELRIKFCQ